MADRIDHDDVSRYSRQMLVPGFFGGAAGQLKLKRARVLVVGCGGLGCPAALYLAGAGVHHLTLVDADHVSVSNLHRQIAHTDSGAKAGAAKTESLATAIRALNPTVHIEVVNERFDSSNGCRLVAGMTVVLDCTDNPGARYLVGDACALCSVPLVSAAALGTDGQLSVHGYCGGPCYRCVHPEPPPRIAVGSCDEQGVLGPVTGAIGSLQALEAIKVIVGASPESVLSARLLVMDAADCRVRVVRLRGRRDDCPVCGAEGRRELADTDEFLRSKHVLKVEASPSCACSDAASSGEWEVPPSVLEPLVTAESSFFAPHGDIDLAKSDPKLISVGSRPAIVLDVRIGPQRAICYLEHTAHLPLHELQTPAGTDQVRRLLEAYPEAEGVVCLCRRGVNSALAAQLLRESGITAWTVPGGLTAFASVSRFPSY
jgi:adenylyltransferase and sulfurtransferase